MCDPSTETIYSEEDKVANLSVYKPYPNLQSTQTCPGVLDVCCRSATRRTSTVETSNDDVSITTPSSKAVINDENSCTCVPYYMCDPNTETIRSEEDVANLGNNCSDVLDVCCKSPLTRMSTVDNTNNDLVRSRSVVNAKQGKSSN